MSNSYKIIVPPTVEPVTLSDIKNYLRVDFSDDDSPIQMLITRSRAFCEAITHRAFCTQQIQQIFTIDRPEGGSLSGPITPGSNWYQYQEQLGANPFGASQFYFDLAMPPIQSSQTVTVETKITAFDTGWTAFTGNTWIDEEPARMYFQSPVTANFWRFTYTAGYNPLPPDLLQALYEAVAYFYQFREAQDLPEALKLKLLARRVDWV